MTSKDTTSLMRSCSNVPFLRLLESLESLSVKTSNPELHPRFQPSGAVFPLTLAVPELEKDLRGPLRGLVRSELLFAPNPSVSSNEALQKWVPKWNHPEDPLFPKADTSHLRCQISLPLAPALRRPADLAAAGADGLLQWDLCGFGRNCCRAGVTRRHAT